MDPNSKVTDKRALECLIELDHETGVMEYKVKVDYDQDILIEDYGDTNLTYKKFETGFTHARDITGVWIKSESHYTLKDKLVEESYKHTIEMATLGEPLQFSVEHKELKPTYQILKDFVLKFKK